MQTSVMKLQSCVDYLDDRMENGLYRFLVLRRSKYNNKPVKSIFKILFFLYFFLLFLVSFQTNISIRVATG